MTPTKLTLALVADPKLLDGHIYPASRLAKMYDTTVEDVRIRKKQAHGLLAGAELAKRENREHGTFHGDILDTTQSPDRFYNDFLKSIKENKDPSKALTKIPISSTSTAPPLFEKPITTAESEKKGDIDKGTVESVLTLNFEPKDVDQLYELHKIDKRLYRISNYWSKLKSNGKFTSSVLATIRKVEKDVGLQKEYILKELVDFVSSSKIIKSYNKMTTAIAEQSITKTQLLEISIPDHHFGKLAHEDETGENYDLKIAGDRYTDAVVGLLKNANLSNVGRIVLPLGNDLLHIDNEKGQTTAGTQVDSDSRFHQIVRRVKEKLIHTINGLSAIAPVDVIIIPGNHDENSAFMIGEILAAFYHNNPGVNINNDPTFRKYYGFGANSFLYTHGNNEKHADLGMIFATENPKLWAETKHRFVKLGHLHKYKKLDYVSTDTMTGFQIQILPSLSGTDSWHKKMGYLGNKQAKAYLYDMDSGEVANYTYTA